MTIKIEMLRCFCLVAQAGKLAEAADRLGRTQSAISMTLKQLEEHLGGALFETERKDRLTQLGIETFKLAKIQLSQFDRTVQAMELLSRSPLGALRIAAVPSVASYVFPSVVRQMVHQYPGLNIELRDADTSQILDMLMQGWADIGLASTKQSLQGFRVSELFSDPFGLVMSENHHLARKPDALKLEHIYQVPTLRNASCEQIGNEEIRSWLSGLEVSVYNTQSLMAMLAEADWVTVLPYSTMGLAHKGLVFRPVKGLSEARQVSLYVRENNTISEIIEEAAGLIGQSAKLLAEKVPKPYVASER